MTKIFYYCTRCACSLEVSDETCAACGVETMDSNRVIHLQTEGSRYSRKRPRGAAAPSFTPPPTPR